MNIDKLLLDERHQRAAELLVAVQAEGAPPEAFVEMLAWCDADLANKLAMERIEEAWAVGAELTPAPLAVTVEPRRPGRVREYFRELLEHPGPLALGAAAVVAIIAIGIVRFGGPPMFDSTQAADRIATDRAAHEKASLPDGSEVELGGKSSVSVVYTAQSRVVIADDGETYFKVSKDRSRPFIVRAGPVTVTAVGTAFVVRRAGESVSVVVTEGAVDIRVDAARSEVEPVRAEAGHRVRYDRGALSQSIESVSPDVALAWREGRLQFVDEPLRLVLASVNRYYGRELLIDPAIEDLRFTGTVFEDGIDPWLKGVAAAFAVRIVEIDQRRVMIAPAKPAT
jgi:transmembrane sensor